MSLKRISEFNNLYPYLTVVLHLHIWNFQKLLKERNLACY